jgi:hypothetical protein
MFTKTTTLTTALAALLAVSAPATAGQADVPGSGWAKNQQADVPGSNWDRQQSDKVPGPRWNEGKQSVPGNSWDQGAQSGRNTQRGAGGTAQKKEFPGSEW